MEVLFYQTGDTITQFTGEHIATVTAALPSKDRWTEFSIFLSQHNEWILQGIGRTRLHGEHDRYWAVISDDPADILQSIIGQDVSRLAKKLLAETLSALADCVCDEEE